MVRSVREKKSGAGMLIFILIMVILFGVTFGYVYALSEEMQILRDEFNELKGDSGKSSSKNEVTGCSVLEGEYYGELVNGNLNMKQTYTFDKDGSYITFVANGGGTGGYYKVVGGKIYFSQRPELGYSNELYNYFYSISDDCKTITAYAGELEYKLNKVK